MYGGTQRLRNVMYQNYKENVKPRALPVFTQLNAQNVFQKVADKVQQEPVDAKTLRAPLVDAKTCTSCVAPSNMNSDGLDPILDPRFNLREAAKHMILLEDHMFQRKRRCEDCITKHILTIEAFLEEAVTLDKTGEYRSKAINSLRQFKKIVNQFMQDLKVKTIDRDNVYYKTAQEIRTVRKPLAIEYANFC